MYQMKVEKTWVISFHKPTFTKPLRPGTWVVKIVYSDDIVLGLTKFLVIPQNHFNGKSATLEDVVLTNNGPPAGLYAPDYVIEFDRGANNTKTLVEEFTKLTRSIGTALEKWIDGHVSKHWIFSGMCKLKSSIENDAENKCISRLPFCFETTWSSLSPDPKSEIGVPNSKGLLLR